MLYNIFQNAAILSVILWYHYNLSEEAGTLSEYHSLDNTDPLKELSNCTRAYSNDGREDQFNALSN